MAQPPVGTTSLHGTALSGQPLWILHPCPQLTGMPAHATSPRPAVPAGRWGGAEAIAKNLAVSGFVYSLQAQCPTLNTRGEAGDKINDSHYMAGPAWGRGRGDTSPAVQSTSASLLVGSGCAGGSKGATDTSPHTRSAHCPSPGSCRAWALPIARRQGRAG